LLIAVYVLLTAAYTFGYNGVVGSISAFSIDLVVYVLETSRLKILVYSSENISFFIRSRTYSYSFILISSSSWSLVSKAYNLASFKEVGSISNLDQSAYF
jgi:hypothetical protein